MNPHHERSNSDGLTKLISENQGVWQFYYDTQGRLYFEGDWIWGNVKSTYSPDTFPAQIEDALCFALLGNFFTYVDDENWEDMSSSDDIWPKDITNKLWHHPAWSNHRGFWTNMDGTGILYDGMGLIRR